MRGIDTAGVVKLPHAEYVVAKDATKCPRCGAAAGKHCYLSALDDPSMMDDVERWSRIEPLPARTLHKARVERETRQPSTGRVRHRA